MRAIKGCNSLAALSSLIELHWDQLGMVPTTAAFVRLAKLSILSGDGGGRGREDSQGPGRGMTGRPPMAERHGEARATKESLLLRLLPRVRQMAQEMDAQGVSNVLWALCKLPPLPQPKQEAGSDPSGGSREAFPLVEELVAVAGRNAEAMDAPNLSTTLYALAVLEQRRGQQQRSVPLRDGAGVSGRQAGVSASSLQPLLDACGPKLFLFGPQALSNTAWALARLGCRPTSAWRVAFLVRSGRVLHRLQPREMATLVWALLKRGVQPDSGWCKRLLRASLLSFHRYGTKAWRCEVACWAAL